MSKKSLLRDRELMEMLADEPGLLAIADAFVETQRAPRARAPRVRGWKPVLAIAAVVFALAGAGVGVAAGVGAFRSPTLYSANQVENAFASQKIELRDVTPNDYSGLLVMLDGRPAHAVYVYVEIAACKCAFVPPITNADNTHDGNVDVLYDPSEKAAVDAALRKLDQGSS